MSRPHTAGPPPTERTARFIVPVPRALRQRIKVHCVRREVPLAIWVEEALREALGRRRRR